MKFQRERLKSYLSIADKHLLRLKSSLKALQATIPIDTEKYIEPFQNRKSHLLTRCPTGLESFRM